MSNSITTLPDLSSDYTLTPEQIESYRQNGHVLLRRVCTPEEVAAYRTALTEAAYHYNVETRPMEERDTYGKAFLQVMNLWVKDDGVRRYVLARRFAERGSYGARDGANTRPVLHGVDFEQWYVRTAQQGARRGPCRGLDRCRLEAAGEQFADQQIAFR